MNQSANDIRCRIKTQRLELDNDERINAAVVIAEKLFKLPSVIKAQRIAVYMPYRGEVDCQFFANSAKLRKKCIFLPVLRNSKLAFAQLKNTEKMRPNRFGILEPVYKNSEILQPSQLDVVIAPLVAFDAQCNRLGMGGGFYDRSFAFRKHRRKWQRPRLIGIAYDFQRVDQLIAEPWDVALDAVITAQHNYRRS